MANRPTVPVVMTFAGNDPTGGAGLQADIEATASMGCHGAPVVTAVTVQDTQGVKEYTAIESGQVISQARAVLEDMPVAAFKIGMLGSVENAEAIHTLLVDYPDIPAVVDPVLAAGNGEPLANNGLKEALTSLVLPLTTILTPNSQEARALAPEADNLDACGHELLDKGCEFVLITGSHEPSEKVENRFFGNNRLLETYTWPRLSGTFHGSGCTLAASLAGLLAQGLEPYTVVYQAQEYTWETLGHAYRVGMGQSLPNRLFWVESADAEDEGR